MSARFAALPDEIKTLKSFVLWRYEGGTGGSKPRKVPYYTNGSLRGKGIGLDTPEDIARLASFDEVCDAYSSHPERWSGIGFALTPQNNVAALDFDNLISNGSGSGSKNALANVPKEIKIILKELIDIGAYIEKSPSGMGVRVIGCAKPFHAITKPFEAYYAKRFVTLTGNCLKNHNGWGCLDNIVNKFQGVARAATTKPAHSITSSDRSGWAETADNVEYIRYALSRIPADCNYDDWLHILCAVRWLDWSAGEELARTWSMGGGNTPTLDIYNEDDFIRAWESISADGGITVGTLLYRADLGRPQPPLVQPLQGGAAAPQLAAPQRDLANAALFAHLHRNKLMYVPETDCVLAYDGLCWRAADHGTDIRGAKAVIAEIERQADELGSQGDIDGQNELRKLAKNNSVLARIKAMIELGWAEEGMATSINEFDADPQLLGVQNGVVSLKTRKLFHPDPELLVSKRANVNFDEAATAPIFEAFLERVQPDKHVRYLLQQLAGIWLYGKPEIQKFIFFYGHGANGKSTFIELFARLLGDYCAAIQTDMLLTQNRSSQGPSPDIVALKGARLAYCNEIAEGKKLDEARVKQLTGSDTLTGRVTYGKSNISFSPTHNLVMVGNHQPTIHDMSDGMWRRVLLINWGIQIPEEERDPQLGEKLWQERAGILNWAIEGWRCYTQEESRQLQIPKCVEKETAAYKSESDILGQWIDENCVVGAQESCHYGTLYGTYADDMRRDGHSPLSKTKFTKKLKERGFNKARDKKNILGIGLKEEVLLGKQMLDAMV